MKTVITFLLGTFAVFNSFGQWQPTGISTTTFEGIYDVASHNGTLFASANTLGFIKSTNNGSSWETVGQSGFTTNFISRRVTHIRSANSELYVATFYTNNASSMIYKSSDNGQTFVADTIGLPKTSNNEVVNIDRLYHYNGYLIADVANIGNYWKHVSDTGWQKNTNLGTEYAELFGYYNSTFYAWGGYHLYKSVDNGQTWSQTANANLPSWFTTYILEVNPDNGRIYVTGRSVVTLEYKLLYSDDQGDSWNEMSIAPYLSMNWLGQQQTIQKLFCKGDFLQIALDNNSANSVPDVFVSTNGGATFMSDTVGLPSNASASTTATAFTFHNDNLFMALNYTDVYKKPFPTLHVPDFENDDLVIFPNPSNGTFFIKSSSNINEIQAYNIHGQLIKTVNTVGVPKIELTSSGMYLLKIIDDQARITIKKVFRN